MAVGASNVQFCTLPMHHGFQTIRDLKSGFADYLDRNELASPLDIVGKALHAIKGQEELATPRTHSEIDLDKCIGCGNCFRSCTDGGHRAIEWNTETRQPSVDPDKCPGCGQCMQVCPVNAIRMKEELENAIHYFQFTGTR